MSYFDISGAVFNNQLRELETSDPAHADVCGRKKQTG